MLRAASHVLRYLLALITNNIQASNSYINWKCRLSLLYAFLEKLTREGTMQMRGILPERDALYYLISVLQGFLRKK